MLDPALRARRYLTANAARKAKFSNGRSQSKPANESSEVAVVYPAPLSEVSSCRLAVGLELEDRDRLVEVDVVVEAEEDADRSVSHRSAPWFEKVSNAVIRDGKEKSQSQQSSAQTTVEVA